MPDLVCPHCSTPNRDGAKFCQGCRTFFLASRYVIGLPVEPVDAPTLFEARDLWRCHACGALIESNTGPACPDCAANPRAPLACQVRRSSLPDKPSSPDDDIETWLYHEHEQVWYGVLRSSWQIDQFPAGQRLTIGHASHPGQRATINEDSLLIELAEQVCDTHLDSIGVLAVADGMGGHSAGDVASRAVVNELRLALVPLLSAAVRPDDPVSIRQSLINAVLTANARVGELGKQQLSDLGATLTAAIIINGLSIIANVGDSRTYLFHAGQLTQITTDHSVVSNLVQANQITPDEIYTHPRRNEIYRCVDGQAQLIVDIFTRKLAPDDRLLLCCDGLWEMVHTEGIDRMLRDIPDPQTACDELIRAANRAGGEDNISVIIADISAYTPQE